VSAVISNCGKYRYHLHRHIGMGGRGSCCFVMLNPSTADALLDDPTIRRCTNFAKALDCDSLEVVNLFAYRATDPGALYAMARDTAVGPDNDHHIIKATALATFVICAWGNHGALFGRDKEVLQLLADKGVKAKALKVNAKSGQPAHPLYLKCGIQPIGFPSHTPSPQRAKNG
jgi:hypothetical protein